MDKEQLQARIESVEKRLRTNLESVEKKLIDLQNDIANFKAKLDEAQDEEIPEFPEFNFKDVTYTLDSCLDVLQEEHGGGTGDGDYTGDDALYYNNFHSKDYADEFRRKCLLIAMILHCKWHLDRDYVPDWGNSDENKYFVFYNNLTNEFGITGRTLSDLGSVAFSNEESARKCADWLNAHWKEDGNGTE